MKKSIYKLFILLILVSAIQIEAQSETTIITLRENNSQGEPVHNGETFTISGIVTSSNQFGAAGPATVQDNTAGIAIYGSDFVSAVNIGDSVKLTSTIKDYNGFTELDFSNNNGSSVTVLKSGIQVEPKIVTLSQIANQAWNDVEELEGSLVRVNSVTINASGSFAGNTNYSISDASGNLELRIDKDVTSLVGVTIPSAAVDIIGIIGQYDRDAPYSSGYQLLPRSIDDIVTESEPLIISPVIAADITTNSFTVYFSTVREGNSEVKYGKTTGLELGSIVINENTTNHKIVIESLESATTYYYKAISTNSNGTSESRIQTVRTASNDTTIGTINVYFNHSVDNSVAIANNNAAGNVNFSAKLLERINNASYSIDMALYSFTGLSDVANAIISAKNNRGVKVRVVYHNRTMQSSMQMLADAGIKISQRPTTDGLMHNKFAIFDGRDDNQRNDWVWTGSWNWTNYDNRNNVVEINSPALAEAYTKEFEEMWGSSDDNPNTSVAKFGAEKTDNTTHSFNIGGRQIDLFFSPSDATESHITNAIATADTSIYFSILSFTSDPIFSSINARHNAGVNDIRGIIDNVEDSGSEFTNLQPISEVFDYNLNGLFHHKYSIIDSYSPTSEPIVITGSHNWSRAANTKNDENTLIIHDIYIANKYMQEFKARYNELGGRNDFTVPLVTTIENKNIVVNKFELYQNYPNPFNPTTTIKYSLPVVATHELPLQNVTLKIYDVLGKEVATLVNKKQSPGNYHVSYNASSLPSGVYFYSLKAGTYFSTKKMLLIK